jgi:hypothetical protein
VLIFFPGNGEHPMEFSYGAKSAKAPISIGKALLFDEVA